MSGDSYGSKGRIVLGDMTNRPPKRGFSLILDDAGPKSRDAKGKARVTGDVTSDIARNVPSGVENLLGEKDKEVGIEQRVSFLKGRRDLNISSTTYIPQTACSDPIHSISDIKQDANDKRLPSTLLQVGDKGCQDQEDIDIVAPALTENFAEGSVSHALSRTSKDLEVGKLASDKFGSIEWSRLPFNPQGRSFELETCKLLKDSDTHKTGIGDDQLDSCTCPFCLKAAYIWTDLHYQDIKGRITALRKSQKEASALVQRTGKGKDTEAAGSRNTSKPSELESNLFNQWRSLFLHMESFLVQEGNQLQANYIALRDLRESCKMDLEAINRAPLNED